jgi:ornithine decarboxylase
MIDTPYLQVNLDEIANSYRDFRAALPIARVHYAMKCQPEPAVLARLHALGCGFEVASAPELAALTAIGVAPESVLFSNPVKAPAHLREAYRAGCYRFAFDSVDELGKLAAYAPGASVYVRLRTEGGGAVASEGKFGVDVPAAVQLLLRARDLGLRPYGGTFHVGSQTLDPGAWRPAIAAAADLMRRVGGHGIRLRMLDIGGGFPAPYEGTDADLGAYGVQIAAAVDELLPYPVEVVAEPGRALAASSGVMVASVIGVAERSGAWWAHLDVGAFGLMEALESGNRLRFPVTDSRASEHRRLWHLTGPTCDSQDSILFGVPLSANLATGDLVYLHSAGAYTTAYAAGTFNGFTPPGIRYATPPPVPVQRGARQAVWACP